MRKLNPPTLDPEKVYKKIKDRSKKKDKQKILGDRQDYVFERYAYYETMKLSLENITQSEILDEEEKSAFLSCYSRNKDGYLEGTVVTEIIENQSLEHREYCPYCGLDKPRTIDHYLPKAIFPEFSIFPLNLIPCCNYCNQKKGEVWLNGANRKFLNFYTDEIPKDVQFLFAELEYKDEELAPSITFKVENRNSIDASLFDLITSHYQNLDLPNQISDRSVQKISYIHTKIMLKPEELETIKESLVMDYETHVENFGLNHWETILIKSIIENRLFFEKALEYYRTITR
ncbi:hypothetical protein QK289_15795 [Exiguobacterium antarcticum]|uniref:HNH endonuclease n=1 Tax=Exiguobacterium antarcticum TaxID=132920 RepID=A0ABT6R692_9BACL|nr:hypothetical protein [Exiguobacterium antarcticum]MDI3236475.1 hypothetical protein [Exiguobacterium antarcticum]